jgi:hypothetical protein
VWNILINLVRLVSMLFIAKISKKTQLENLPRHFRIEIVPKYTLQMTKTELHIRYQTSK